MCWLVFVVCCFLFVCHAFQTNTNKQTNRSDQWLKGATTAGPAAGETWLPGARLVGWLLGGWLFFLLGWVLFAVALSAKDLVLKDTGQVSPYEVFDCQGAKQNLCLLLALLYSLRTYRDMRKRAHEAFSIYPGPWDPFPYSSQRNRFVSPSRLDGQS